MRVARQRARAVEHPRTAGHPPPGAPRFRGGPRARPGRGSLAGGPFEARRLSRIRHHRGAVARQHRVRARRDRRQRGARSPPPGRSPQHLATAHPPPGAAPQGVSAARARRRRPRVRVATRRP
jgi:hypothetical protein